MVGGTVVCCRDITAKAIYDAIADEGVTHFGGAPIVLNHRQRQGAKTAAPSITWSRSSPPAPPRRRHAGGDRAAGLQRHAGLRADRDLWPATECTWHEAAGAAGPGDARAAIKARQGVAMPMMEDITVMDPETMAAGADGRRRAGRDHDPRQLGDEGLPTRTPRPRPRLSRAAISTPATSPCSIPTAISRSPTARRTSSSRAARTSARSRSRAR
jgi:hypothetical protein